MRREELYLADLVDNARAVRGYLDSVTRERWDADGMLRDAVLYRMMLLGEIASALPEDLRDRHPDVAWRQIRAFRNLAVHKYFGVDWAVVWKIAQEEPSVLEKQALAIITAEYPELAKTYEPGPDLEPGTESLRGRADAADFCQDGKLLFPCLPELGGQPQLRPQPGQGSGIQVRMQVLRTGRLTQHCAVVRRRPLRRLLGRGLHDRAPVHSVRRDVFHLVRPLGHCGVQASRRRRSHVAAPRAAAV
jgi:uncharacterized protein with HEPN domain